MTINGPDDVSVIIAADGIEPAPGDIELSWPLDNSTPWSGPLIVGGALGGIALVGGVALGVVSFLGAEGEKDRGFRYRVDGSGLE
jgi:hypothetical protein